MESNNILIEIAKSLAVQAIRSGEYTEEQLNELMYITCRLLSIIKI